MVAISLAFLICLISSSARVFLKKGLVETNVHTGMIFSLYIGWAVLFCFFVFDYLAHGFPSLKGIFYFSAIGIIAPPIVRYLTYVGIDKLGAGSSDQIRSLTPVFGIFFADSFFGEEVSGQSYAAGLLITLGLYVLNLSYSKQGHSEETLKKIKKYFWYPLIAAIIAGLVANLRKLGGQQDISSVAAAFFAASSALVVYTLFLLVTGKIKTIEYKKGTAGLLIISAALTSLTDILDIYVLKQSKISYILPILSTTPLFVLMASAIFLRRFETVNRYTFISAGIIFCGVQLILVQNW